MLHDVVVIWPGSCKNLRFVTPNMSQSQDVAATWWPNARNMFCPIMLRYVALKRYDSSTGLANTAPYTELI